ncbi:MAG: hypothetical protein ACYS0G_04625 [Planctomycetota bacterium]|jgi:hypothetical protein
MVSSVGYERTAWEDRFNRPTVENLRAALEPPSAKLFSLLRRQLRELDGVREQLAWHGDCWRWTIEYRTRHSDDPLAVLVPSPTDLQLAVPLEREFTRSIPTRRMTRALRDGLGLAQEPFDTRWGVWSIQTAAILGDVVDLIELKLRHLAKQVG